MPKPPDYSDDAQREAAIEAVVRDYGKVIGRQQADNIVCAVLVAARSAELRKYRDDKKEPQADSTPVFPSNRPAGE